MLRMSLLLAAASILTSGDAVAQVKTGEGTVGKIAVTASGKVSFNGVAVTLDALKTKLAELRQRRAPVWY